MAIQWYPGHMHKAQKDIKKLLGNVDLIIEILDARIPFSSTNPVIELLSDNSGNPKPRLKVMNKSDLADPVSTKVWEDYFAQSQGVKTLKMSSDKASQVKNIVTLCHQMFPEHEARLRPIQAMVVGIPNVGKSTIINLLAGRAIAKTGNEAAVTKTQQRIDLKNGIVLFDTPGMLWPKIENDNSAYRLAITGAIKDTVIDYVEIADYLLEYLLTYHPDTLQKHFKLDELPRDAYSALEVIGRSRGTMKSGGRVDLDKISKIIIKEYRSATIGNISLENPIMIENENAIAAQKAQQKADKKAARKKNFKKR
uniref:Ribosome biogenesis GTPase A n=1 Tax=uncultured Thiotrichaceae bacterium TaxID=298394 RepID=A0A6S6UFD3_9GAMM|nr:MAG: 50S ribosomal subunit maturation GTPase RbgA (B. subtilis YlqF) [uncultured Thiotrichaceae bacterium]